MFGADPVSVVALNTEGHLLAIQPVGIGSFPLQGSKCLVADPKSDALWRPETEDFFDGGQIFGETENVRAARWGYEPGVVHKSFGFEQSPLDEVPFVRLVVTEAMHNKISVFLVISVLGVLLSCAAVVRQFFLKGRLARRFVLGLVCALPLPAIGFYGFLATAITAPSSRLFWSSVIIGTILAAGVIWVFKNWSRRAIG
ncbi:hypothetical protein FEE96_03255 [Parasedimentitalea maritima]|uniref:LptF/LptG family permease n=1 Tax=Parasedimentitalea maritima TaxID=2578117 RepID=A0ABY2V0U3_9RHOB|nr:hypothetical protein [Zongyanglinia marina]TLP69316.1 hypothetical protein FEE96_03255 [Zongyanglinia marina]